MTNVAEPHPDLSPAFSSAPVATENAGAATPRRPIPALHVAAVLLGFPGIFWLYSQALLHRDLFSIRGVDFFVTFWLGATLLYAAKIGIIARVLAHSGWTFREIGYGLTRRGTARLLAGYAVGALAVFAFVELSLTQVALDPAKLEALPGLYPETTLKRLVFLVMAFAAGLGEEITYRGFAIRALEGLRINRWLAVPVAAIPFVFQHGLKSLDQFWWFLGWGLTLGLLFVLTRRLLPGIIIHWLIILTAMLGVFAAMQ